MGAGAGGSGGAWRCSSPPSHSKGGPFWTDAMHARSAPPGAAVRAFIRVSRSKLKQLPQYSSPSAAAQPLELVLSHALTGEMQQRQQKVEEAVCTACAAQV
ncbi:unnamed protein product [Closterium sp. NIES-65]|nr:unnamed protein product [Closterium sp. NIES-65]